MNANGLAKEYGKLRPCERLPAILAAEARGDEAERDRLVRSAPVETCSVSNHRWLTQALFELTMMHALELLDVAACFWQAWGLTLVHEEQAGKRKGKAAREAEEREWKTYCMLRHFAYRFTVRVDAWKQFCAELKIDPQALLAYLPGGRDTIDRTEPKARELAFREEQVALMLAVETLEVTGAMPERSAVAVETAEALAREWHKILDLACPPEQRE